MAETLANNALLKALLESHPDGVFAFDRTGKLLLWSERCESITGWDIASLTRPEPAQAEALAALGPALDGSFPERKQILIPSASGESLWVEVTYLFIHEAEAGETLVGIMRGIGRMKAMESDLAAERDFLQSVINGIRNPIKIIDRDFRIVHVNQAAVEWTGKDCDHLASKNCYAQFFGRTVRCDFCESGKVFQSGKPARGAYSGTDEEGRPYTGEIQCFPIFDEQGQVRNVIEITHDLTREKAIEEQLLQSAKLASLGEVAAGIAHEVRNPLTGIKLGLDALGDAVKEDAENADTIRNIALDIDRLNGVVTQLLDFAKVKPPVRKTVDVNQVLRRSAGLIRRQARQNGIELIENLSTAAMTFTADPDRMQQVFLNILLNAVQAMPDGGRLTIHSEPRLQLPQTDDVHAVPGFRIRISDTGKGIEPAHLKRLFDPFFTTKPNGTGLGLSVSYRYVKEQGGDIRFESKMGRGTTVTVLLPRWPQGDHAAEDIGR